MKQIGILNRDISDAVADLGHTDTLVVADAGLPIPQNVRRIDISLRAGLPGMIETLETIAVELRAEKIIMASEAQTDNPGMIEGIRKVFPGLEWEFVPHTQFKEMTKGAKAVVRTGEFTHYANVILVAGVVF